LKSVNIATDSCGHDFVERHTMTTFFEGTKLVSFSK
jgi:hypothetical protein